MSREVKSKKKVGPKSEEQSVAIGAPVPSLCPKSTKEQGISLELQDKGDKQGRKVEAEDGGIHEISNEERKKKNLEKAKARRDRKRVARKQEIASGEVVGVSKSSTAMEPLDMKARKTEARRRSSTERGREKQGESQNKPALSKKVLKARSIMRYNSGVAATGLWGYIAIDPDYLAKGTIDKWVDAAADALADSKRLADYVSYLSAPSAKSNGGGKEGKKVPSIVVCFRTTDELEKALGPISIMGFTTRVVRFRGPKGRTFKIPLPPSLPNGEKMRQAFEEKAKAKLEAWGWRQYKEMKSHFVFQCQLPPRRDVNAIKIDGWRLECIRVEEGKCCCCGEAHNCFASGTECSQFVLGHRLSYV